MCIPISKDNIRGMTSGRPRGAVIVTGASRGIGAAIALALARRGFPVCINHSNSAAQADEVCAAIAANGGTALVVQADLASEQQIVRLFEQVDRHLGRLYGLVNNAAYVGRCGRRVDEADAAVLHRTFSINAIAPFLCAREALKRISARKGGAGGRIVNVSSIASRAGSADDWVDYAASKAAINTFTLGLAREVASESVQVNGVSPGVIDTTIHARSGSPERLAVMGSKSPMGRPGLATEVADVVAWLIAEAPDYVHGTTIEVSGGL